jgi:hypothetical protein
MLEGVYDRFPGLGSPVVSSEEFLGPRGVRRGFLSFPTIVSSRVVFSSGFSRVVGSIGSRLPPTFYIFYPTLVSLIWGKGTGNLVILGR